ncbi:MAG: hypothetical protein KBD78_15745 [Oligoflexales bacterium]|nr:hypothetical protein [Oligoflexales bacterium]
MIVHRYLEEAPESIYSAHAHGFAPGLDSVEGIEARLLNQYKIVNKFFDQNPRAKANFDKLLAYLSPNRCYRHGKDEVCGIDTLNELGSFFSFQNQWPDLVDLFTSQEMLFKANGEINIENLKKFIKYLNFEPSKSDEDPQDVGGETISLMEIFPENVTVDDPTGCVRAYNRLVYSLKIEASKMYFNECASKLKLDADTNESIYSLGKFLGYIDLDIEVIKANLLENQIPFYLYSGELDGMAPPTIFTKEVSLLSDLVY